MVSFICVCCTRSYNAECTSDINCNTPLSLHKSNHVLYVDREWDCYVYSPVIVYGRLVPAGINHLSTTNSISKHLTASIWMEVWKAHLSCGARARDHHKLICKMNVWNLVSLNCVLRTFILLLLSCAFSTSTMNCHIQRMRQGVRRPGKRRERSWRRRKEREKNRTHNLSRFISSSSFLCHSFFVVSPAQCVCAFIFVCVVCAFWTQNYHTININNNTSRAYQYRQQPHTQS